ANGTNTRATSARFTTSTSTITRPNMMHQASSKPHPRVQAVAVRLSSRLWRANESVTAVDETRPPVTPGKTIPLPAPNHPPPTEPTSDRLEISSTSNQSE